MPYSRADSEKENPLLREALFTFRLAVWSFVNPVLLLLLLREIITFCEGDRRVGTGPERLGGLTHDFEADPKVTPLKID